MEIERLEQSNKDRKVLLRRILKKISEFMRLPANLEYKIAVVNARSAKRDDFLMRKMRNSVTLNDDDIAKYLRILWLDFTKSTSYKSKVCCNSSSRAAEESKMSNTAGFIDRQLFCLLTLDVTTFTNETNFTIQLQMLSDNNEFISKTKKIIIEKNKQKQCTNGKFLFVKVPFKKIVCKKVAIVIKIFRGKASCPKSFS